jgi:hypothetical protein
MNIDALLNDVAFKLIVREFVTAYKPNQVNEFLEPLVNRIFEVCGNDGQARVYTKPTPKIKEIVQAETQPGSVESEVPKKRGRKKGSKNAPKERVDSERMTPGEVKKLDELNKLNASDKSGKDKAEILKIVKAARFKGLKQVMIPLEYSVSDIEPFLQANGVACGSLGKSLYPTTSPKYWILDFESNLAGAMRL